MARRTLAMVLFVLVVGNVFAPPADAGARQPVGEQVLLELDDALERVLPAPARIEHTRLRLDRAMRRRIGQRCGRRLLERRVELFRGLDARGTTTGYAIVVEEIGKYRPITFAVGVSPRGAVYDVAVMVYRESHGGGVARERFLAQFRGKDLTDPLDPNRDVINLSGATLSVRAIARGVRKALAVIAVTLLEPDEHAPAPRWRPFAADAEPEHAPSAPPAAPHRKTERPVREARWRMGTLLTITAYAPPPRARRAFDAAFAEVARLEALLSTWRADSTLSRVNAHAAARPVALDPDTFACIAAALHAAARTGGAFDPTLRPQGYRTVRLDPKARTVYFERRDLTLDLGGIAKGYALDRAAALLERHGVHRALLDFGGQLLALDPPPGRPGWAVMVLDPHDPRRPLAGAWLAHGSIAASNTRERGAHIIDPRTGARTRAPYSAHVFAPTATAADMLSTACFVLGPRALDRVLGPGEAAIVLGAQIHTAGAAPIWRLLDPAEPATP